MSSPSTFALGVAALRDGRLEDAIVLLRQAAAESGDPAAWNLLGLAALRDDDYEQAAAALRTAVELEPESAEYHYNLGCALEWGGALEEAVPAYETACRLRPEHSEAGAGLRRLRMAGVGAESADGPTPAGERPDGSSSAESLPRPLPDHFLIRKGLRDWFLAITQPERLLREKQQRRGWAGLAAYVVAFSGILALVQLLLLSSRPAIGPAISPLEFAAGIFVFNVFFLWIPLLLVGGLIHRFSRRMGSQAGLLASCLAVALAMAPAPLLLLVSGCVVQNIQGRPAPVDFTGGFPFAVGRMTIDAGRDDSENGASALDLAAPDRAETGESDLPGTDHGIRAEIKIEYSDPVATLLDTGAVIGWFWWGALLTLGISRLSSLEPMQALLAAIWGVGASALLLSGLVLLFILVA